jgi:hypothetical protein
MMNRITRWAVITLMAGALAVACGSDENSTSRTMPALEINIPMSSGGTITATWQPVRNARVVVLLIPTVGYTRSSWESSADRFNTTGWSVLRIDSPTPAVGMAGEGAAWTVSSQDSAAIITEMTDRIHTAIDYVQRTAGENSHIALIGSDLAGVASVYAAGSSQAVGGVGLISPPGGLTDLMAQGLVSTFGDRPLIVMTEFPINSVSTTARTMDSWLGRGSSIALPAPGIPETLVDRDAAFTALVNWIRAATL